MLLNSLRQNPHPVKSDVIALEKRNQGNEKFRMKNWLDAIELYGDSLRFAKPGSEHISLGYANRATCFLKLNRYDNCLKDIDLAFEAGYPDHLKPKLEQRRKICLEQMENNPQQPQPNQGVSIQPDERFPHLARDLAQVRKNLNGDYSVVAKTDIDVGKVFVVEEPLHKICLDRPSWMCVVCLKTYGNLVPCGKCAVAMLCTECQRENPIHDDECDLHLDADNPLNKIMMGLVRCILSTLADFPSVDDLMSFVELVRKNPHELPMHLQDLRSKYHVYFAKPTQSFKLLGEETKTSIYAVFKTLLRVPAIEEKFQATKHRRFLMHMIGHGFFCPIRSISRGQTYIFHTIMDKYIKHSSDPNTQHMIRDGKFIWITSKSIKKNEELFISISK